MKKYIFYLISGIIVWFFIFRWACGEHKEKTDIVTKTDIIVRTRIIVDTFYRDTGSIKCVPYFVQLPAEIDTPASILGYYTFKSVQDSFIGKNYQILLDDTLYMNSLFARKATISVIQVDSIIHTKETITKRPNGVYIGAETNLSSIGPDIMFIKNRWSYGGNVKFDPWGFKAKELNLRANYKLFGK